MKPKKKIFVVSRDDNLKQPGVAESEIIASLYSEIKPLCYVGMALGTFPLFPGLKSSSSVLTTSAPLWLYSLSVYSALCYISIRVSPNLDILNVRGVPLEDALANILQFVHRIYFFAVVPISWYNSFCIRQHFNMWLPFLSKYYTLTGEVLILNLRYIRNIFFTMAAAGMLVYYAVSLQFSSKNNIWETFCCSYGDTLVISNASFYIFTCFACKRCFQHLRNYARKQILAPFSVRPENIGKFRDMYSHVHLLLQSFGEESALLFIFVLLLMSSMFVLSVFSAVMAILQQVDPQKYLIFIIDAIGTLVGVILCCFCGQMIFEEAQKLLDEDFGVTDTTQMDVDTKYEIQLLLQVLSTKKAIINFGGFGQVNRALLTSLFSTVVTYLVVLVQFKVSVPQNENDGCTAGTNERANCTCYG